jgi:hypothetical protein
MSPCPQDREIFVSYGVPERRRTPLGLDIMANRRGDYGPVSVPRFDHRSRSIRASEEGERRCIVSDGFSSWRIHLEQNKAISSLWNSQESFISMMI